MEPRRNKPLIQRVRCLLTAVLSHHDLAISWVKAHTGLTTPEAVGNATAERLDRLRYPLVPLGDASRVASHIKNFWKVQLKTNPKIQCSNIRLTLVAQMENQFF